MALRLDRIRPGDVICTRNPRGLPAFLIRLGAALLDRPNTVNHVIVAHHVDAAGTFWGIEARPGGVGWIDLARARGAYTLSNHRQPKTDEQRLAVCAAVEGMLGTPYDWKGIALAAANAVGVQRLWASDAKVAPAHVICSALADWAYDHVGLDSPGAVAGRATTPGDWASWIVERGWRD